LSANEFGITVSCYRGDLPLLKGCLASIRANLPKPLPICLIMHGRFPIDDLVRRYDLTILDEGEIDSRLRTSSFGYGLTKMIAFWHSPFSHFLHIDSDAVCWGDFTKGLPWQEYDLIYNEPHEVITPHIQTTQYFDPDIVFSRLPMFPWKGQPFFNTGVFAARKGIFALEEYLDLLAFQKRNPKSLLCGDQGILNLLAFRQITGSRLKARSWPFQAVVPVVPLEELNRRFRFEHGTPVIQEADRRLIHWAGPKPSLRKGAAFRQPMIHYRREHLRRGKSLWRFLGQFALILEEIHIRITGRHGGSYRRAILSKLRWWATPAKINL
jgi:hypothetical protein